MRDLAIKHGAKDDAVVDREQECARLNVDENFNEQQFLKDVAAEGYQIEPFE